MLARQPVSTDVNSHDESAQATDAPQLPIRAFNSPVRRPLYPSCAAIGADASQLERFFLDRVSLAVWRRGIDPQIREAVLDALPGREVEWTAKLAVNSIALDDLLRDLPNRAGRHAWEADIQALIELFSVVADCTQVGARLMITGNSTCPKFHTDRVGVRLICTWIGPGSEWLEHLDVDRRKLGHDACGRNDYESGLILPGGAIHRLAPFDVALFKGDSWPGNRGRAIVHRSPPMSLKNGWRVMLTLDEL